MSPVQAAPMVLFEEAHWPLVVIVGSGPYTDGDIAEYLVRFRKYATRGEPVYVLSDARAKAMPSTHYRKRIAEMADAIEAYEPKVVRATSAVLTSALLVGAARAVSFLRGGRDVTHYVSTGVEALAWLRGRAAADGVELPASAGAFARDLDDHYAAGDAPEAWLPLTQTTSKG
ncbi:MAG: hypothetical protein K8H88_10825 [Sandaracinaceae bacterium]|nr:hypothetical protein [Sandaracinaceae bacterium]